jgi:hypothetical protein
MIIWPEYITLNDWAGALTADYPSEFIPLLQDENKWHEWGAIIVSSGVFERAGIPSPFSIIEGKKKFDFEKWQDWAKIVYINMSSAEMINNKIIL